MLAALVLAGGTGSCGGSPRAVPVDAPALLRRAKAAADAALAVHFVLTSSNVTGTGTNIVRGQGDLVRPDAMQGSFTVTLSGLDADVKVISKGPVFEAELPFTSRYTRADPASFGLTNPALLLDPARGLTSLLLIGKNPRSTGRIRVAGELLDEVAIDVPGRSIPVLPDANPSRPVTLVAGIDATTGQLRQVRLVGPFTSATSNATYVLTLSNYGEKVIVSLPPVT